MIRQSQPAARMNQLFKLNLGGIKRECLIIATNFGAEAVNNFTFKINQLIEWEKISSKISVPQVEFIAMDSTQPVPYTYHRCGEISDRQTMAHEARPL